MRPKMRECLVVGELGDSSLHKGDNGFLQSVLGLGPRHWRRGIVEGVLEILDMEPRRDAKFV